MSIGEVFLQKIGGNRLLFDCPKNNRFWDNTTFILKPYMPVYLTCLD